MGGAENSRGGLLDLRLKRAQCTRARSISSADMSTDREVNKLCSLALVLIGRTCSLCTSLILCLYQKCMHSIRPPLCCLLLQPRELAANNVPSSVTIAIVEMFFPKCKEALCSPMCWCFYHHESSSCCTAIRGVYRPC